MSLLGEAIMAVCQPHRINYEILGNSLPVLHAHVWPRYDWGAAMNSNTNQPGSIRENIDMPGNRNTQKKNTACSRSV